MRRKMVKIDKLKQCIDFIKIFLKLKHNHMFILQCSRCNSVYLDRDYEKEEGRYYIASYVCRNCGAVITETQITNDLKEVRK